MSQRDGQEFPSWASPGGAGDLDEAYEDLLALVGHQPHPDEFLREVLQLVQQIATATVACSATVWRDGQPETVAITSPLATFADEVQYALSDGPCLRCLRTGQLVAVPRMAEEHRWPDLAQRAFAQGVGSCLCLPLIVRGSVLAAVNVYAAEPRALAGAEQEKLSALTARASGCLAVLGHQN